MNFWCPICLYILGYKLVNNDHNYRKAYRYISILIISSTFYAFFSVVKTIRTYGSLSNALDSFGGREVINLWNSSIIAATGLNTILAFSLGLLPILFFTDKKLRHRKKIKLLVLSCFLASAYCTIQIGNRTGMIIILVSFIIVMLCSQKISFKKIITLICVSVLLLILKYLYDQDFLGIKYYWTRTILYSRFQGNGLANDPRVAAWQVAFYGLFQNPIGGRLTQLPFSIGFAHNIWLDVGYDSGIIPFVMLVIFTLISIKSLINFRNQNHPLMLKVILIGLFTSILITFFSEPILRGWNSCFNLYCFIVGVVQRLNFDNKLNNSDSKINTESVEKIS
jgi:oligosaccharide repeat unit polymerase